MKAESNICSVCKEIFNNQKFFMCSKCGISSHMECNLYSDKEYKKFSINKCDICRTIDNLNLTPNEKENFLKEAKCRFCQKSEGILKKLIEVNKKEKWSHLSCMKWFINIRLVFENGFTIFMVKENLPNDILLGDCNICKKTSKGDFLVKCGHNKCENYFHSKCILNKNLQETIKGEGDKLEYYSFHCEEHKNKKKTDVLSNVKTYGNGLNLSNSNELQKIKFDYDFRSISEEQKIILNTHKATIVEDGKDNNLKIKLKFEEKADEIPAVQNLHKKIKRRPHLHQINHNTHSLRTETEDFDFVNSFCRCDICLRTIEETEWGVKKCRNCLTYSHQSCSKEFGDKGDVELCRKCMIDNHFQEVCFVCERGYGNMVKCGDRWVHIICMLCHKNYFYKKTDGMFTWAINSYKVPKFPTMCDVCRKNNCFTTNCKNCKINFHPYCGFIANFQIFRYENKNASTDILTKFEVEIPCENHQFFKNNEEKEKEKEKEPFNHISPHTPIKRKRHTTSGNHKYKSLFHKIKEKRKKKKIDESSTNDNQKEIYKTKLRHSRAYMKLPWNKKISSFDYKLLRTKLILSKKIDPLKLANTEQFNLEMLDPYFLALSEVEINSLFNVPEIQQQTSSEILESCVCSSSDEVKNKTVSEHPNTNNDIYICKFKNSKGEYIALYNAGSLREIKRNPNSNLPLLKEIAQIPSVDNNFKFCTKRQRPMDESMTLYSKNYNVKILNDVNEQTSAYDEGSINSGLPNNIDSNNNTGIINTNSSITKVKLIIQDEDAEMSVNGNTFSIGKDTSAQGNQSNDNQSSGGMRSKKCIKKLRLEGFSELKPMESFILNYEENAITNIQESLKTSKTRKSLSMLDDIDEEILIKTEMLASVYNDNRRNLTSLSQKIRNNMTHFTYDQKIIEENRTLLKKYKSIANYSYLRGRLQNGCQDKTCEGLLLNSRQFGSKSILTDELKGKDLKSSLEEIFICDSECCVCLYSDSEDTTPIVFCESCNVSVHQNCYGIKEIPEGDYLCDYCSFVQNCKPSIVEWKECILCGNSKGALKKLDQTGKFWAHCTCILLSKEISFADYSTLNEVQGFLGELKHNPSDCSICKKNFGDLFPCSQCGNVYHFFCAYFEGLELKITEDISHENFDCEPTKRLILHILRCSQCQNNPVDSSKERKLQKDLRIIIYQKDQGPNSISTPKGEKSQSLCSSNSDTKLSITNVDSSVMKQSRDYFKETLLEDKISICEGDFEKNPMELYNQSNEDDETRLLHSSDNPELCVICFKTSQEEGRGVDNILIQCHQCKIAFHNSCYYHNSLSINKLGISCDLCKFVRRRKLNKEFIRCLLCSYSGGAFKNCISGKIMKSKYSSWIHVLCAKYFDEIHINQHKRNFEGFDSIKPTKLYQFQCQLCLQKRGGVIKCLLKSCDAKFHPYCAIVNALVPEKIDRRQGFYCKTHSIIYSQCKTQFSLCFLKLKNYLQISESTFNDEISSVLETTNDSKFFFRFNGDDLFFHLLQNLSENSIKTLIEIINTN